MTLGCPKGQNSLKKKWLGAGCRKRKCGIEGEVKRQLGDRKKESRKQKKEKGKGREEIRKGQVRFRLWERYMNGNIGLEQGGTACIKGGMGAASSDGPHQEKGLENSDGME